MTSNVNIKSLGEKFIEDIESLEQVVGLFNFQIKGFSHEFQIKILKIYTSGIRYVAVPNYVPKDAHSVTFKGGSVEDALETCLASFISNVKKGTELHPYMWF